MAHRGKGRGRSNPGPPPEYLKSEDAQAWDSPAGDTRFDILGNGQGYSFEHDGEMIFLFGDTINNDPNVVNYHAHDPLLILLGYYQRKEKIF